VRILHTSDWHLGRSFHRVGMLAHQAAFVDHLLEVVESEGVDLVVVAGDVYDRALPHVDAVRLADDALARLAASRARVVLTSGNHDSARRLGFGSRLIDAAGIHVRTDASTVGTPVVLHDEHGPVAVHGIPYLDPQALHEPWGLPARTHEAALAEALRRIRADLEARPSRSVVLAHAFVAGGLPSDSERDISIGGVSAVPTSLFDDISYTALGHLHGRATLTETVRYSGSPLAYSFSEAGHTKGCWLVDLGPRGVTATSFVPAPVPRPLSVLTGDLESLLSDPRWSDAEGHWVQATLTDAVRPDRPMERLRARFPETLVLRFAPDGEQPAPVAAAPARGRSDHEVALDFVAAMRGAPATAEESALLLTACDACADDPDADVLVSAGSGG
jgi:exonuclease SbcD